MTRDAKGLTPQDRARKAICAKIDAEVRKLPDDRETLLAITYTAAHAMRLAINLEARIAEGEQG